MLSLYIEDNVSAHKLDTQSGQHVATCSSIHMATGRIIKAVEESFAAKSQVAAKNCHSGVKPMPNEETIASAGAWF